jgi:hypothetical protein
MPRDLQAILDEAEARAVAAAEKLIKPRKDNVEAFRTQLKARIGVARRHHQETANLPLPGEMKALAVAYTNALKRARRAAGAVKPVYQSGERAAQFQDFLAALDCEILRVRMDALDCLVVRDGARPRDTVADLAAFMARDLMDPDPYRHPENRGKDLPAIECPWRQPAKLTYKRPWLELAALIYEGATGKDAPDMMKYCREVDDLKPRYVVRLPFKAPS